MKTFVINLPRSKDRADSINENFSSLSIDFEFFAAVDGRELSIKEKNEVYDRELAETHYIPLDDGEIGCTLSHKKIYEKMIAEDIQECLIFEDDVVLSKTSKVYIDNLKTYLPKDTDILLLGHVGSKFLRSQKLALKKLYDGRRMGKSYALTGGTQGYYITLAGAKKILAQLTPKMRLTIDDITGDMLVGNHTLYAIIPPVVELRGCESTIEIDYMANRKSNIIRYNKLKRALMIKMPVLKKLFYFENKI